MDQRLQSYPEWKAGLWFQYLQASSGKPRYCQVDGLLQLDDKLVIVEIKYQHCVDAYFQLNNLYLPVIQAVYPDTPLALCEVVKWYDPSTAFPCPIVLRDKVHKARPGDFSVHILNR